MDTHSNMIDIIGYSLTDNLATKRLGPVTILTIRNLLYLYLHNNVFYYQNRIYTFKKGSPTTMPLTETLSNIYLFVWQKKLLKELDPKGEFFGR